ncbi:hypothetical protein [Nostoc sp.]
MMQIIEISPFQAFRRSVATVMQVVPKELRYVTILGLVGGAGPAIAIWLKSLQKQAQIYFTQTRYTTLVIYIAQ